MPSESAGTYDPPNEPFAPVVAGEAPPLLVARVTARNWNDSRAGLAEHLCDAARAIKASPDNTGESWGGVNRDRDWEYTITEGEPEAGASEPVVHLRRPHEGCWCGESGTPYDIGPREVVTCRACLSAALKYAWLQAQERGDEPGAARDAGVKPLPPCALTTLVRGYIRGDHTLTELEAALRGAEGAAVPEPVAAETPPTPVVAELIAEMRRFQLRTELAEGEARDLRVEVAELRARSIPEQVWHCRVVGGTICGAWGPNEGRTDRLENVTCEACKAEVWGTVPLPAPPEGERAELPMDQHVRAVFLAVARECERRATE